MAVARQRYYSLNKRQRAGVILTLIILICMTFTFMLPTYADGVKKAPQTSDDFEDDIAEIDAESSICASAFKFEVTAYGLNPTYSLINTAKLKLKSIGFMAADGDENAVWSVLEGWYDAMKVIGIMLVFLYFVIDIIERVKAENMTADIMMRRLLAFAIGVLVVVYGFTIFKNIWILGDKLLDVVAGNAADQDELYSALYARWISVAEQPFWDYFPTALGAILTTLLYYLMQIVIVLVLNLVIYTRLLELMVRIMFAPIGVANMFSSGGQHAQGVVYMKKFASISIQGAVMLGVIVASQYVRLAGSTGGAGDASLFTAILLPLAAIGVITKSKSLSDDIVGVH